MFDDLYGVDTSFADPSDPQPLPTPAQMARWHREGMLVAGGVLALIAIMVAGIAWAAFEAMGR